MEKPTHNRTQALQNLQRFIDEYSLVDIKDNLFDLYKAWMLTNANTVDGDEVVNMLVFYDQLRAFIEQVYLLKESTSRQ